MIRIHISQTGLETQFEAQLAQARRPKELLMRCGLELQKRLVAHFRQKDGSEPNRLSARRQHFWLQAARSVKAPVLTGDNQVSVTASDPRLAQKVFGGPITARQAGALTIPVSERAYGRSAAAFEAETGLKLFVVARQGGAALAARLGTELEVEYVLKTRVNQAADPTALPEMGALEQAIREKGWQE